jgi:Tol biopolymer transport system component
MTSGQDVWQLTSVEYPNYITAIGRVFSPPARQDSLPSYGYLRLNFDCASDTSLIELYTGQDMGLTFIYRPDGYPDVYIEDFQGRRYLVSLIGSCWLAAPMPQASPEDSYYSLHFQSLPPFNINPQVASNITSVKIVFVSDQDFNPEIYSMSQDASEIIRLTNNPASDTQPAWSPDHRRIIFTSNRDGNAEIYRIESNGDNPVNLTTNPSEDRSAAWKQDGSEIAFETFRTGNWEIYTMQADGSNPRNLSNHPDADAQPSWSPDGKQIVFQSHRDGNWEIYTQDITKGNSRRLTEHPADDLAPSWSPDGDWIAFWSQRNGSWGLYLISVDGIQLRPLVQFVNPGTELGRPGWSTDGSALIFAIQHENNLELYQISSDGTEVQRLTDNDTDDYQPDW